MVQNRYYLHFKEAVDIDDVAEAFVGDLEPVQITQMYATSFELQTALSLSKVKYALDQWFRKSEFIICKIKDIAYHVSE